MSKIPQLVNDQAASAPALKTLFDRYYDRLLYFAWQYVRDRETARDLVQDAFVTYWHNAQAVSPEENRIKNYLYVNVRNGCLKYLRHHEVIGKYHHTLEADPAEEAQGLQRIIHAEIVGEIHRVIASLPEPLRKISQLSYLEGLKNHEIAEQLDMPVNTVKSHKQKAMQQMRLNLNPETFAALLVMLKLLR